MTGFTKRTHKPPFARRFSFFSRSALALVIALAALLSAGCSLPETYPRRYEEEVLAASEKYALDPNLVFAVIRTESSFRAEAVSSAGAKGLMQLMDVSAEWVCWRQGTELDASRIFEPAYNIDLGCYLLAYLLDRYGGNIANAAAAYNAGAGTVDRWLADPELYDGETLSIPYGETRSYVQKVLDSYEKYTEQANKAG